MSHPHFRTVPHIFISYKHEHPSSEDAVRQLIEQLDSLKVKPLPTADSQAVATYWIDEHMTGGANWKKEIADNLGWCDIFIILVSDPALRSTFITDTEVATVLNKRKPDSSTSANPIMYPIIVSTIDESAIPSWLDDANYRPSGTIKVGSTKKRKKTLQDVLEAENDPGNFWITFVRDDLRKIITSFSASPNLSRSSVRSVDLITSVKGGVGKTLLSLGLTYCHLDSRNGKILAVDANTSNVDFWGFLHKRGINYPTPRFASQNWQESPLFEDRYGRILKKERHSHLFSGCGDFWAQIIEMMSIERRATSAIIDTNLMIGNLSYITNCIDAIRTISAASIKARLWIIWTFHALREKHYIERDLIDIEHALNDSPGIQLIHVLNPSALIPEKINPEPGKIQREKTGHVSDITQILELLNEKVRALNERVPGHIPDEYTGGVVKLSREITDVFGNQEAAQPLFASHVYAPLAKLAQNRINKCMTFPEFHQQLEPLLELLEGIPSPLGGPEDLDPIFEKWLAGSFVEGCPQNVVPWAYYNVNLKGYTDYTKHRPTSIEGLRNFLGREFVESIQATLDYVEVEE